MKDLATDLRLITYPNILLKATRILYGSIQHLYMKLGSQLFNFFMIYYINIAALPFVRPTYNCRIYTGILEIEEFVIKKFYINYKMLYYLYNNRKYKSVNQTCEEY